MMTTPEAQMTAARGRTFLHRTRTLLFLTGAFAVAYVAMTLLHAKFYQEAAENILDKKNRAQRQHEAGLPIKAAKQGDVLGRIEIPRLGVMIAILEGTSAQTLRLGAGHIKGTAFPGEPGNSGIAGHRDTFFRPLKDIRTNDEIQIQTATACLVTRSIGCGSSRRTIPEFLIPQPLLPLRSLPVTRSISSVQLRNDLSCMPSRSNSQLVTTI